MNINLTLIGQAISFAIFVWFCMKFIWPPLLAALEERQKLIEEGLTAADKGKESLVKATAEADEIINDPNGVFSNYFLYLNTVSKLASGTLSKDINIKSELPDAMKKAKDLIIIGDQSTVIDKLIEFIDIVGPFGTLLITGHDFGNSRKLWESSFAKMSENVEPILSKYLKQKFAA